MTRPEWVVRLVVRWRARLGIVRWSAREGRIDKGAS